MRDLIFWRRYIEESGHVSCAAVSLSVPRRFERKQYLRNVSKHYPNTQLHNSHDLNPLLRAYFLCSEFLFSFELYDFPERHNWTIYRYRTRLLNGILGHNNDNGGNNVYFSETSKSPLLFLINGVPRIWMVSPSVTRDRNTHAPNMQWQTLAFCSLPLEPLDEEGNLRNCD